jgi:DNA invertase Pin-like site-specific DNA recombinase
MMKIGYARVSTLEQNTELQIKELKQAGCKKVFKDQVSGVKADRPGLKAALEYVRPGDSLVVWKLDRLGRNLKHLIEVVEDLEQRGIGFISLTEGFDTSTNGGKMVFQIFGALAQFERNLIRERTMAGLAAARARGRKGGKKPKLNAAQVETMKKMYDSRKHSISEICEIMKISKPTLYKYLRQVESSPAIMGE